MSDPKVQMAHIENPIPEANKKKGGEEAPPPAISLGSYATLGAAALLLLSVVEWIDLNARPFTPFDSVFDRATLALYFSLNVMVGLLIGLIIGLLARTASLAKKAVRKIIPGTGQMSIVISLVAGLTVAAVSAFLLNQQPHINRYIIGMIREAEKFRFLRNPLLNHERATSYLLLMALVAACWLLWRISRSSGAMNRFLRVLWILCLAVSIGLAYYVDSRIEVQLYEYTMHRSMYILNLILSLSLAASIYFSLPAVQSRRHRIKSPIRKIAVIAAVVVFIASLAFTFFHFGKDQGLKSMVFYQTTQAKQNFKLTMWALDFDRDGYSALLDGGDAADGQKSVNPGQAESVGDGLDNNCIGGDLTDRDLNRWRDEHVNLRVSPVAQANKYNIIYFFIDTVRADHLSSYGYHRNTTPNLDRLAARSSVFEHAFSPSPRTSEAVPKFMQSSYWDAHLDSWTQVLARSDYNVMLFPGRRSWERYKEWMPVVKKAQGKPLDANIDFVMETLSNTSTDQPFCAYVYVPDPHRPYIKHDDFNFGSSVTDLYDGELAYTDYHLGRIFDWMEQTGRFNNTMVVIMADHGESLGERGVYKHATQLYNEQIHVPMIVYVPNQTPRRINDYVSTIDLGSTILSAVGVDYPRQYLGISLMALIRGEAFTRPPVYGEQTSQEISPYVRLDQQVHPESKKYMVIVQDGFKLIYNRDFNNFELFDLKSDPGEQRNLYDRMPEKSMELKTFLGHFVDIVTASRPWDADEGRYSRSSGIDGDKVED
jgi:glucan phosphoethanolaminetransferase (alkaline phosphatase superfamily)